MKPFRYQSLFGTQALKLVMFLAMVTVIIPACGDNDDANLSAAIVDLEISPESGYPGVDIGISFTIEPDASTPQDTLRWRIRYGDGQSTMGDTLQAQARHQYELSGDYQIEIAVLAGDTTVQTRTYPYRVYDPVDLAVSGTRGSPANIQTGEQLTVSFDISNELGAPIETPFEVRAFLASEPDITLDTITELPELFDQTITANDDQSPIIESGQTRNFGISAEVPDIASGTYYIVVWIDPENQVADENRANNLHISPNFINLENLSQILPDIVVNNVYAFPDRAFPALNQFSRGFTLSNKGNEDIFDVIHKTYLSIGSDQLQDDAILVHTSSPLNIPARSDIIIDPEQLILLDEIIPDIEEELLVYVIVEAHSTDSDVEEIAVDNNIAAAPTPITVSDQLVDGPDIAVKDFSVTPNSTFLDGNIEIHATIANEGNANVGSFFCGIYMGEEPRLNVDLDPRLSNINISALPVGETRELIRNITIAGLYDPGVYYFYIVCDPVGAIPETFRSNNHALYLDPITITDEADVDMFVDSLTVPSNVHEGEEYTIIAKICTTGTNPTGLTRAELYRTHGASVRFSADPVDTFDVPNINPNQCVDVEITRTAQCDDFQDIYSFGIVIDATERLPELDENNNTQSGTTPVQITGDYCACVDDDFEPNNRPIDAAPLQSGPTDAAVCSPGSCDYFSIDANAGDSVIVHNTFEADKGSLVTTLFDETGLRVLDRKTANDANHQVAEFLASDNATYILSVCGAQPSSRNFYSLDIDVIPQPENVDVLPYDIIIPPRDIYTVGSSIDVGLRIYNIGQIPASPFQAQVLLLDQAHVDAANPRIIATQTVDALAAGAFRDITIPSTLPVSLDAGQYYIAVKLDPSDTINDTNLSNNMALSRSIDINSDCYDPFQPNNSFDEATRIEAGTYSNLVSCTGASDYYEICVDDAKQLSAAVNFQNTGGDIDIELFNDQYTRIASSINSGVNQEQVNIDYVNGSQCYYLRVYMLEHPGNPSSQNQYDLTVDIQDVDQSLRCDAAFEPNNSFATASSLLSALQHPTTLDRCPITDTDYYYIYLAAGQTVSFRGLLEPDTQAGALRIQIYRPNQAPGPNIETAPGVPVAEIEDYTAPQSGQFYVQVTVSGSARRVTYRLEADGLAGIDLQASNLIIGPGTYDGGDEVRFAFDITNLRSTDIESPSYAVYLADSTVLTDDNNHILGTFMSEDIAGNTSITVNNKTNLPESVIAGVSYLHIVVDPDDELQDANRSNNRIVVPIQLNDSSE